MTLLSAGALAGLLLIAPLVFLHLRRRRPPAIAVDSLRDWRQLGATSPAGRSRFSPPPLPLLLALQLLALALLVFALARPASDPGTPPSVRAYVVDESIWMGAREGDGTRIEAARERLRDRLEALPAGQRVALVAAGTTPTVLFEGPAGSASSAVADLRVGAGDADLGAALRLASGLRGSSADPLTLLRAPEDRPPRVQGGLLVDSVVGERGLADLEALASFACVPADPRRCEGLARVYNRGESTRSARLRIEPSGGRPRELRVAPRPGHTVFTHFPLAPGQTARVRLLGGDALAADDAGFVAVPSVAGIRVTLVGERARALPLARALAAVPGVRLRVRAPADYRPSDARTSDLLVLDDFLPAGGLPRAPALLLVHPPRLPGGSVAAAPLADSRLSDQLQGTFSLAGVDLSALTIDAGAAERIDLPRWAAAIAWAPGGPLLAAGSAAGRWVEVLAFDPSESNLTGLAGFPTLVSNLVALAAEWTPSSALAGEPFFVEAPESPRVTIVGAGASRRVPGGALAAATISRPGIYTLSARTGDGVRRSRIAVNPLLEPWPRSTVPVDLRLAAPAAVDDGAEWWPWLLAAALVVLLAEAIYAFRREPRPAWREASARVRLAVALQCLALALVALALFDPTIGGGGSPATVVVDRSRSIGAEDSASERPWFDAAAECGSRCPLLQFAGAGAFTDPDDESLGAAGRSSLGPGETDLGEALSLGLARTPNGGRLVLLSDGLGTESNLSPAADEAIRRGVAIDVVPLETRPDDAGVTRVELPPALHAGDPFSLQVTVRSSFAATAKLTLTRDGEEIGSQSVRLRQGDNPYLFSLRAPSASGSYVYGARVAAAGDTVPGNDRLEAATRIAGAPRALVVARTGSPIAGLLQADGIEVETLPAGALPSTVGGYRPFDAVLLEGVSASALGDERAAVLASAVHDDALGLFVLGGPNSFSLGRYYDSPLAAALPVRSLEPGRRQRRNLALELVLDRSGSMIDEVGGVPKIEMAQAAARGALRFVARHSDQLGIVSFDARPRTLVPLTPVTDAATARAVEAKIDGLLPEGGTDIYAGLAAGAKAIEASDAKDRHIVLLSDGVSDPGSYRQLLPELRRDRISVATVALGAEADSKLLRAIAAETGGNFYQSEDARELPRIFTKEAKLNARPVQLRGALGVEAGASSPIVSSLLGRRLPPLFANVVTTLRPGAEAPLLAEDRGNRAPDPVLAQWQYGAGRVVAWTAGLDPAFAGTWAERTRLFSDAARWVERGAAIAPLTPGPVSDQEVMVDNLSRPGAPRDLAGLRGSLRGPDDETTPLRFDFRAPGEALADTPHLAPGQYGFAVSDGATTTRGQLAIPYRAEFVPPNLEATPLGPLAEATGGTFLDPGDSGSLAGGGHRLWRWAALAALVCFLAGAALRLLGRGVARPPRPVSASPVDEFASIG